MNRTISAQSGHTFHVSSISRSDLPLDTSYRADGKTPCLMDEVDQFDTFYVVRNWDKDGVVMLYLGKGHAQAPKQIIAWYRNSGAMWSGCGTTLKEAIDGAQRDGWMYA